MKKVLIVGATSAIAQAAARLWAAEGHALALLGRDAARLQVLAADVAVRGAAATHVGVLDADDLALHASAVDAALAALAALTAQGGLDIALIAHGVLPDQAACERDVALALQSFHTNAVSVVSLLTILAQRMQPQGHGVLAVIGSVAGDRGRASNHVYGAAKGAVALFTQGLRQRLHPFGVQVLLIKPGFVDTPMTRAFTKGPLWATPQRVAQGIVQAVAARRAQVYLPGFWAAIMLCIRLVPTAVFNKLKL